MQGLCPAFFCCVRQKSLRLIKKKKKKKKKLLNRLSIKTQAYRNIALRVSISYSWDGSPQPQVHSRVGT